jgi:excisionase family DNA binding protein
MITTDFTIEQLLLTTTQAARALGVSRTTIYKLIAKGELVPTHIGRSARISLAELRRFVARLDAQASPRTPGKGSATVHRERRTSRAQPAGQPSLFVVEAPPADDDKPK